MTDEAETPKSFIYWAGLSAISAVMKRQVWTDCFYYKVYPNIFCLIVADSGLRKGLAIKIAEKFVRGVNNTRCIAGRNSIEGVIQDLSMAFIPGPGIPPITQACAALISDELSNLFIGNPQTTTVLHALYDSNYNEVWDNTLKSGREKLKDPCVTLFGATNESLYTDTIQKKDINGGFLGRTIIIEEKRRNRNNPLTRAPQRKIDFEPFIHYLKSISAITGEFKYSDAGRRLYEEWYQDLCDKNMEDRTGTVARLNTHVIKISMCLSLSRGTSLIHEYEDIEAAIDACTNLTIAVSKLAGTGGNGEFSGVIDKLLTLLIEEPTHRMTRKRILRKLYGHVLSSDLENITQTLVEAGVVNRENINFESWIGLTKDVVDNIVNRPVKDVKKGNGKDKVERI